MKHLVLLGGGHAHLFVLQRLAQRRVASITLVSPCRWHYYSGMLPGWIAGHYSLEQCRIDLQALASSAGIRFIEARADRVDTVNSIVTTDSGERLAYDLLSLDTGSDTRLDDLRGLETGLLPIKPLHNFVSSWSGIAEAAAQRGPGRPWHVAVVGGGAAGVELSLAIRHALAKTCHISFIAGKSGVLAGNAKRLRTRATRQLCGAGIEIVDSDAQVREGVLFAGREFDVDTVLATTGPAAPSWLRDSGLQLDDRGYVLVDSCHRSCSHPSVFAAGDICSRAGTTMTRSGVHAVRAGPVLADNLLAALRGLPLRAYRPRRRVLYLLSCGRRYAIASWGSFSLEGRWVWQWKDRIDRGFIRRFSESQRENNT